MLHDVRLVINKSHIQENYKALAHLTGTAILPVLKANAYSVGVNEVAPILSDCGAKRFFVATIPEGIHLRKLLPQAERIYILNGFIDKEQADALHTYNLSPVINTAAQLDVWKDSHIPCVLHIDTGMKRLGFSINEAKHIPPQLLSIDYIMSHLACAGSLDHAFNAEQHRKFQQVKDIFPHIPLSLSASEGVALGTSYAYDGVRCGSALFGVTPHIPKLQFALKAQARILQTSTLEKGESCGYNQAFIAPSFLQTATIAAGFFDGIAMAATNKARVYIDNQALPIIGRVSMDLTIIDTSPLASPPSVGDWVTLFDDAPTFFTLARDAQTGYYETMTRLGSRFQRLIQD